jgi:hypothetical protein
MNTEKEKKQAVEFKEVEGAVSDQTAEKPLTKALRSYDGDGDGKLSGKIWATARCCPNLP